MSESGLLQEVRWEWDGSELTADAPAGSLTVSVEDPTRYAAEEDVWVGEEGPYEVASVDEEAGAVTLARGLVTAAAEGDPLTLDAGGGPARVWVADVVLQDADGPVEVPLTVGDLVSLREGPYDPPVAVLLSDDLARVLDLPGSEPAVDGAYLLPGTAQEAAKPVSRPEVSPALSVTPRQRGLTAYAGPVADVHTSLRFEVARNSSFEQVVLTVHDRATTVTLAPTPDRVDLYVRVTAYNEIGEAPPSPIVGPVRTMLIESVDVGDFTMTARKFLTSTHMLY